ncbi:hypothetical protein [Alkalibacillus silvisoli]
MSEVLNATDVRKHWGQFNDDVVREGPKFVKRNRDYWAALSTEHLKIAFSNFTFEAEVMHEDDKTVTMSLNGFDIVENGDSVEETLDLLAEELIDYSNEYKDDFNKYFNAPDRRDQFPFIMNVLIQDGSEGVKSLIRCLPGER